MEIQYCCQAGLRYVYKVALCIYIIRVEQALDNAPS